MKCVIPEISWNNRDPVFSLDIQPKVDEYIRLATSGSDCHIVIWYLIVDDCGTVSVEPAADLNKHQKAVNVVRWSPSGEFLASGDDESSIIIWKKRTDVDPPPLEADSEEYKESWTIYKILRGHMDDVYDISWSSDSNQLISGSVDNTAILWNLKKSTKYIIQPAHKGFVQGVTWDPLNKYFATLSSDRTCRIFDAYTRKIISRSSKGTLPFPESSPLYGKTVRLYHDDTLKSYFRRLTFSPDGSLLIAPAGCVETDLCRKKLYFTYIYTRYSFKQPTLALPCDQFTVAVRCCPVLFELRADGPKPMIPLPYRMIIAVASQTSVVFYDTQQIHPFAAVTNIHYTRITDITWSHDGLIVAISSTDGFCSLVTFKIGELGDIYIPEEKNVIEQVEVTKTTEVEDEPIQLISDINSQDISLHLEDESQNSQDEEISISDQEKMQVDEIEDKSTDNSNSNNTSENIITGLDKNSTNTVFSNFSTKQLENITEFDQESISAINDNQTERSNQLKTENKENCSINTDNEFIEKLENKPKNVTETDQKENSSNIDTVTEENMEVDSIDESSNQMKAKTEGGSTNDEQLENNSENLTKFDKENSSNIIDSNKSTTTIANNQENMEVEAINEDSYQVKTETDGVSSKQLENNPENITGSDTKKNSPIKKFLDNEQTQTDEISINNTNSTNKSEQQPEKTNLDQKQTKTTDMCELNDNHSISNETNENKNIKITPKAPRRVQLITLSSPKSKKQLLN